MWEPRVEDECEPFHRVEKRGGTRSMALFVGGSWGIGLLTEDDGGLGAIWLGVSG